MPRAVRFDHYGDIDVLYLAEVQVPNRAPDRSSYGSAPPGSTSGRTRSGPV